MRERTGYIFKLGNRWVGRATFTDETGKRRTIKRTGETKTEARLRLQAALKKFDQHGETILDGDKLTFAELAQKYEEARLIPATYVDGKKVAGMRNVGTPKLFLRVLTEHFGRKRVKEIRHVDIENFKLKRLKTPTRTGEQRTIASVNRELETLRTTLRFAIRNGWLEKNPFNTGESLIDTASETRRDRILTFDEEARLLAACTGQRTHLKPLLIAALDTGLRRGELFKLVWSDISFEDETIAVRAINAKTNKPRTVGMTRRLKVTLQELKASREELELAPEEAESVFGLTCHVKKSFRSACKAAEIKDLHFHDLRHCFVSRMIQAGMSISEAMRLSGHSTLDAFNRYVNVNHETRQRATTALDGLLAAHIQQDLLAETAAQSTLIN
jgi:integrase